MTLLTELTVQGQQPYWIWVGVLGNEVVVYKVDKVRGRPCFVIAVWKCLSAMLVYKDPIAFDQIIKGDIGHQYCTVQI